MPSIEGHRIVDDEAIVGLDLDYEVLGASNGMLMVSASGTAVMIDKAIQAM